MITGIVVAALAAFVLSGVYYGAMPDVGGESAAPQRPMAAQVLVEMTRNLAVTGLLAGLLAAANWSGVITGASLGASLWALPVVLLAGAVFHEGVPVRRAGLHGGDWLLKLIVIGAILGWFS